MNAEKTVSSANIDVKTQLLAGISYVYSSYKVGHHILLWTTPDLIGWGELKKSSSLSINLQPVK